MSAVSIRHSLREYEKSGSTIYESSYRKEVNGSVVEVMGHNGTHYIVVLNNQIQLIEVKDFNEGERAE